MTATDYQKQRSTRIGFYSILLGICWTCTVVVSLLWNLHLMDQETEEVALNVARAYMQSDQRYRRWNTSLGGVYVPLNDRQVHHRLPAHVADQEIITPSGRRYTLASHAFMMAQVYSLSGQNYIARGELKSLDPISPGGEPDDWETGALKELQNGAAEVGEIMNIAGERVVLLMLPFTLEKPCLKCHAGDGYGVGEVRGGIVARIPLSVFGIGSLERVRVLYWGHLFFWFLGIAGLAISFFRMRSRVQERERAEAALDKFRLQQKKILSAAGEGIYGVDMNGITTFVNPAAAKMLGWEPEELIGRSQHYTIHHTKPDGTPYPEEECPISAAVYDGQVHQGTDEVYFRKDGTSFPVDFISTPVMDKGKVTGAVITFADVSARKKAEEDIIKAQLYLQSIINAMPSILIGVDLEGRVTQWNIEATRVTGHQPEEAYGMKLEEVCPMLVDKIPAIRQAVDEHIIKKLESVYCAPQDGAGRYTDIIIYPLSLDDYNGAVIRIDDVSERVLMEDRLVQSEKMTSVVGLVEGMAHEINNPLGGIIQGAQNVLRRFSLELPKNLEVAEELGIDLQKVQNYMEERQIPKFLEGIRTSGKKAADIVSYMLQFSQVHQAPKELRNLEKLLVSLLETISSDDEYRAKYRLEKIEIIKDFEPDIPKVPCITSEVEQVVRNLIRNAIQAVMHPDLEQREPRIIIRTRHETDTNMVLIELEDNGIGMDESVQRRVFEPFFTTKPPGEGTGLGLAVSYFLITVAHQGLMDVESEPGKGTRFSIRLPLTNMIAEQ